MREEILNTPSADIFYRVAGSGQPVLLIHGFGEDGRVWNSLLESLSRDFLLIVPDLPGSGHSKMKGGDWSMEALAETVRAITLREDLKAFTVIGHSMGGYVALALAEKYPTILKGLGLFHSTAFADSEEKKITRKRGIQFIEDHGQLKFLEQATPNLFSETSKATKPHVISDLIEIFTNFQEGALVHYYEAMMDRPDRTHILKNHPGPVMFILGESDTAVPLADGLKQSHLPRLSYIHILRNSGHMGMIEETDKCREILQKFLHDL